MGYWDDQHEMEGLTPNQKRWARSPQGRALRTLQRSEARLQRAREARDSTAADALRAGASLRDVGAVLGWSKNKVRARFADAIDQRAPTSFRGHPQDPLPS